MKEKPNKPKSNHKTVSQPQKQAIQKVNINYWIIIAGLLILTLVVFFPMLQNQFTSWDDTDYITKNTKIWELNSKSVGYLFTQPMALNYHPLTMLSLAINYSFSKLNPYSYYLTNLVLHLLNVAFVFLFIYKLSKKNINVATFVALIFAIHPMHVESVAWASERKDVLYTFFFLGALIAYLEFIELGKKIFYIITFALTILSMLSKPAAIILPLVLILLDFYRGRPLNIKSQLNKIPFFAVAAFFMYMTFKAQITDSTEVGEFTKYTFLERIFLASYGFMAYFIKLFFPVRLAAFHPYPKPLGMQEYFAPVLAVLLFALAWFRKKNRKLLLFGLLFYTVNLILVLQFVSIGSAVIAERYTYVSYIGLLFVFGMLLFESNIKLSKTILWLGLGIAASILSYQAHARVLVWHDNISLWTDMIAKYPLSDRGYYGRGNQYARDNQHEKAIADFTKGIEVSNDKKSYNNRGASYYKLKRYEEAINDYTSCLAIDSTMDKSILGRAYAYYKLNRYEEALKDANETIRLHPDYDSYIFRFTVYRDTEKYPEALADFEKAASYTSDIGVYSQRGSLYFKMNNLEKAIEDYTLVLNKNPNDALALSNRGAAYFQLNKIDEAFVDALKSTSIDPNIPNNFKVLAYVYDTKGNKELAIQNGEKAIKFGLVLKPEFMKKMGK